MKIGSTEIIRFEDQRVQPWKNGKGTTREIAIDDEIPFRWRISSAMLTESSEFSEFIGYDRSLYLASGGPISLYHNGKEHGVNLGEIYCFSGDLKTHMTLSSPAVDVNIFCLRDKCEATVNLQNVLAGEALILTNHEQVSFAYCDKGSIKIDGNQESSEIQISQGDAMRLNLSHSQQIRAICIDNAALLCIGFRYK